MVVPSNTPQRVVRPQYQCVVRSGGNIDHIVHDKDGFVAIVGCSVTQLAVAIMAQSPQSQVLLDVHGEIHIGCDIDD